MTAVLALAAPLPLIHRCIAQPSEDQPPLAPALAAVAEAGLGIQTDACQPSMRERRCHARVRPESHNESLPSEWRRGIKVVYFLSRVQKIVYFLQEVHYFSSDVHWPSS
jgi:hypothetical protein